VVKKMGAESIRIHKTFSMMLIKGMIKGIPSISVFIGTFGNYAV
jgi:hypothetical protein